MKTAITTFAFSFLLALTGSAGSKITIKDLPAPVKKVIAEYFPGSTLISAEKEIDDGKTEYEVKIQYKKIKLEVEASATGEILDVEMKEKAK